jgi:hypothetical protein
VGRSAAALPTTSTCPRRRAGNVVAYLGSPGVKPDLISAGRLGDTHPVASNDTPDGRGKNKRIVVLEGPRPWLSTRSIDTASEKERSDETHCSASQ